MLPSLFPSRLEPKKLMGVDVLPEEARSILRPQKDDRFGFGFSLNPYRGCTNSCRYCFVREYPNLLHSIEDWGTWCSPKLNAPELLWTHRHRIHGQSVFMSTGTDPFQPLEKEYRISRACLMVLLECPDTTVNVYTRSPIILEDIGLLKEFGMRLQVGISIPTDDDTVRQIIEPKASSIPIRWKMAERLSDAGISVTIAATPIFPMQSVSTFIRRCMDSGAKNAWAGRLRLINDDPFLAVLKANKWMYMFEEGYGAELKAGLGEAFYADVCTKATAKKTKGKKEDKKTPSKRLVEIQQPLF
ncbi:MAG: radical SAM protein [Holophagaceae bacterium]|nr:radical SAM protein [Holophagaceae bacterium]